MTTQTETTEKVHTVLTQTEALKAARITNMQAKSSKPDLPRKGDFFGIQDEDGQFGETGIIKAHTVGSLVSVILDRTGHTQMFATSGLKRIGSHEWAFTYAN